MNREQLIDMLRLVSASVASGKSDSRQLRTVEQYRDELSILVQGMSDTEKLRFAAILSLLGEPAIRLESSERGGEEADFEKTWGRQGAKPEEADFEKTWGRQGAKPEEADFEKTWGRQGAKPEEADFEKTWGRQ